jgi:hypothetical protein
MGFAGFAAWAVSSGETEKPARMAGFFFSYSISSEYHIERGKPAKYLRGYKDVSGAECDVITLDFGVGS